MSNRAAARYDKANSQHLAAKEMIRVAESQLAACRAEQLSKPGEEPPSPSPFDLAWQEMLNHATSKVLIHPYGESVLSRSLAFVTERLF